MDSGCESCGVKMAAFIIYQTFGFCQIESRLVFGFNRKKGLINNTSSSVFVICECAECRLLDNMLVLGGICFI